MDIVVGRLAARGVTAIRLLHTFHVALPGKGRGLKSIDQGWGIDVSAT